MNEDTSGQSRDNQAIRPQRRRGAPPYNKNHLVHGYYAYKALLSGRSLDQRTSLSKALLDKECELVQALGGDTEITPQQKLLITDSVNTTLYIGSLDQYLMGLKSLVRKGRCHSVLAERTRLAAHLRENLKTLGLARVAKSAMLSDLFADEPDETVSPARQDDAGSTISNGDGQSINLWMREIAAGKRSGAARAADRTSCVFCASKEWLSEF